MGTINTNATDASRQQDADYNAADLPWNAVAEYVVTDDYNEARYTLNGVTVGLDLDAGRESNVYVSFGDGQGNEITRSQLMRLQYITMHPVVKSWSHGHSPLHAIAMNTPERQQYNAAYLAKIAAGSFYGEAPDQPIPVLTVTVPESTVQALYCVADHSVSILEYTNGDGMSIARTLDPHDGMEQIVTLGIVRNEPCMELQIADVQRLRALLNHPDVAYLLDTPVDTIVQTDPRIASDPRIRHARTRLAQGLTAFPDRRNRAPIIGCDCKACTEIAAAYPDTPAVPA